MLKERENANKDIEKESEEYQGTIDENESYRKELNVFACKISQKNEAFEDLERINKHTDNSFRENESLRS